MADALEEGPPGDRAVVWPLPEDRFWRLRPALDAAFVDYLEHQRETRTFHPEDPFVELYFEFLRFLNGLMVSDAAFSHCIEWKKGDGRLKILCKDPSRFLGAVIDRTHATIGLSATLSPPEFYTGLLGFSVGRTAFVEIANPFPAANRRVVIDPSVATTFRARPANYQRIADRLAAFADSVPGNCLALFPSYAFLAEVTGRMRLRNKRVLIQRQADSDAEREVLLQALRSAIFGDILLAAVAGGVFAEGVDYPGEVLKAVAVVGPCLPAMTLEQELLKEYYEERFERGFEFSFVVPGMTRVVQAAGRLIRSPEDTGVIALFDQRFLHSPYRDYLPADWLPEEGGPAPWWASRRGRRRSSSAPSRRGADAFSKRRAPGCVPGARSSGRPRSAGRGAVLHADREAVRLGDARGAAAAAADVDGLDSASRAVPRRLPQLRRSEGPQRFAVQRQPDSQALLHGHRPFRDSGADLPRESE